MPQLIPILFTAAGAATVIPAAAATWLTIISTVAVTAYQVDKAKRMERRARDAYNASLQDRQITVRSAISTRPYVLGTIRTSGALACAALGEFEVLICPHKLRNVQQIQTEIDEITGCGRWNGVLA